MHAQKKLICFVPLTRNALYALIYGQYSRVIAITNKTTVEKKGISII